MAVTPAPNGFLGAAMPLLSNMQQAVGQAEKMVAPAAKQIQTKANEAQKMLAPAADQLKKKAGEAETQIQEKAHEVMRLAEEAKEKSQTVAPPDAGKTETTHSKLTKSSEFRQRFTARKEKIGLINYDKALVLG